jgi:hypothetical protein
MTAPKFGPCIECNDFGIVRMLIPVDAEASSSSTLGGALTSRKHLLIYRKKSAAYGQYAVNVVKVQALINLIMDETKVNFEDRNGTVREYVSKESMIGKSVGRRFCSRCGK